MDRRWKRLLTVLVLLLAGCRAPRWHVPCQVEANVVSAAATRADVIEPPVTPVAYFTAAPPELPALWSVALSNNPALREASAEIEAARGQFVQAGRYLNPDVTYQETGIGDTRDARGTLQVQLRQEIITSGKRDLDMAIAERSTNIAFVGLLNRKYAVLTNVRRLHYDYRALGFTLSVNDDVVDTLSAARESTRQLVEDVQSRPRHNLERIDALLGEARIGQARGRINLEMAWKQLVAELGVPDSAMPEPRPTLSDEPPLWGDRDVLSRVTATNLEIRQAAAVVEQSRVRVDRARAQAYPNVTVGAGYQNQYTANQPGAIVSVQVPLPVYDRRQGQIAEAESRVVQTEAARQSVVNRLHRDTAEALARFQGASEQDRRLTRDVLPVLEKSLQGVRQEYEAGAPRVTFADVLLATQNLNAAKLRRADVRRELWRAVADLEGLMQLDVDETLAEPRPQPAPPAPEPAR